MYAGASLKPLVSRALIRAASSLPRCMYAGASLKHSFLSASIIMRMKTPPVHVRRGLIEAQRIWPFSTLFLSPPVHVRRGLIEARRNGATTGVRPRPPPVHVRRGLIEAQTTSAVVALPRATPPVHVRRGLIEAGCRRHADRADRKLPRCMYAGASLKRNVRTSPARTADRPPPVHVRRGLIEACFFSCFAYQLLLLPRCMYAGASLKLRASQRFLRVQPSAPPVHVRRGLIEARAGHLRRCRGHRSPGACTPGPH